MKLYFAPNSRAIRIAWLLEELGITYEIEKYTVGDKALRTPEYFKLHPMGRVPVLEDKGITIYESGAILEYLLAKYDTGNFHPNKDDETFPYYLQWLHYAEGSIMPHVNTIVVETILLPLERKNEVNVARAFKLLNIALINVNNNLENKDFLTGKFSGADIMTGHACIGAKRVGADISKMGNISNYIECLMSRPALQKAMKI